MNREIMRIVWALGLCILVPSSSASAPKESPPNAVNYGRPFEPPTRPAFIPLPPGAVEPEGLTWLSTT